MATLLKCFGLKDARLKEPGEDESSHIVHSGRPGPSGDLPSVSYQLVCPDTSMISASLSGPDGGAEAIKALAADLSLDWNCGSPHAFGQSVSMYDLAPCGQPIGEPIADCFGLISYGKGDAGIVVVADGVNWGEPARRAARCAVLGVLHHMHLALSKLSLECSEDSKTRLTSCAILKELIKSMEVAQQLITKHMGTMTTVVATVLLPHSSSCKHYKAPKQLVRAPTWPRLGSHATEDVQHASWVAMTLTVGDSRAWVWRANSQQVEELTSAAHEGEIRDIRCTQGGLGYAEGEDPDLANMTASATLMAPGDIVFLGTDGIADNYDPVVLKLARPNYSSSDPPSITGSSDVQSIRPSLTAHQLQAKHLQLLSDTLRDISSSGTQPASPAAQPPPAPGQLQVPPVAPQRLPQASSMREVKYQLADRMNSARSHASKEPALTAQSLVIGLMARTKQATEALRDATAKRAAAAAEAARRKPTMVGVMDLDASSTELSNQYSPLARVTLPPGKLDHATIAALQVPFH